MDVRSTVQPRTSAAPLRWWLWPLVIVVSTLGVSVVAFADAHSPLRPLLALWFLGICPGMAFVRLLDIKEGYVQLTLAVALSLTLDTIVATVLLYAHLWSPTHILGLVAGLSLGAVALDVAVVHRTKRRAGSADQSTATI